jgi:hypothetical protein
MAHYRLTIREKKPPGVETTGDRRESPIPMTWTRTSQGCYGMMIKASSSDSGGERSGIMVEKQICKYCKYWNATPSTVDPEKIIRSRDPAVAAIAKKLNEYRAKSGQCTRQSPSFTLTGYEQWSAVQDDYFCNRFERKRS